MVPASLGVIGLWRVFELVASLSRQDFVFFALVHEHRIHSRASTHPGLDCLVVMLVLVLFARACPTCLWSAT